MIIGISTDPLTLNQKFAEKEKLTFPLYSDADHKVAKVFGVSTGKNASRATFVIDKEGKIAKVYAPVKNAGGHPQEVLEYVEKTFKKKT